MGGGGKGGGVEGGVDSGEVAEMREDDGGECVVALGAEVVDVARQVVVAVRVERVGDGGAVRWELLAVGMAVQ